MAKLVDSPFKIYGTLDDLNFYPSADGNIVRMKGKTGITKEQFRNNPIFEPIWKQGAAFGFCSLKAKVFKGLVQPFYTQVHAGSLFGRCIQLLLAILHEGTPQDDLQMQFTEGLSTDSAKQFLLGFEGNEHCTLNRVLTTPIAFDWERLQLSITQLNSSTAILWPEGATQVHVQLAISNWNCATDFFETCYSNTLILYKSDDLNSLDFALTLPQEHHLWLAFIHFRFGYVQYNKVKFLPKLFHSVTLIGVR